MKTATLTMPRLGETMEQGEVIGWLIEVGQKFKRGDAILELETDKTIVEYPALGNGTLAEILVAQGDLVKVGEPIARIDLAGATDWTAMHPNYSAPAQKPSAHECLAGPDPVPTPRPDAARPRATPVARQLARNTGIDLGRLTGTGRRGRIEASDVKSAAVAGAGVLFSHDIAYVRAGPVSGVPFLLIHGFAGDHTTFAVLANALQRRGCFTVACDLPGHGATRIKAERPEDLSTNLSNFSHALFGGTPFHLVAHSLGTVPAFHLAAALTLASLTLIAPVGLGHAANSRFLDGMAAPGSTDSVKSLLDQLTEKPMALSEDAIGAVFAEQSRGRLVQLAKSLGAQNPDKISELDRLTQTVTTRILIGQKDRVLMPDGKGELPPEVAVHSFSRSGHMPHWENPRAVANILLAAAGLNQKPA